MTSKTLRVIEMKSVGMPFGRLVGDYILRFSEESLWGKTEGLFKVNNRHVMISRRSWSADTEVNGARRHDASKIQVSEDVIVSRRVHTCTWRYLRSVLQSG